jgi:predicted ribosome quality control (RQC) complex YloA/Tae2 family protein
MRVKVDFTKSPQANANDYYNLSKSLMQKKAGAMKAITDLQKRLKEMEEKSGEDEGKQQKAFLKAKKEWYEKFHWFFTSDGLLAIGGRDAVQNEALNSKHFEEGDLFFHADIFGASVVTLKSGAGSSAEAREESAQFAASYSSAWKNGAPSVDVYAMRRDQVSKSTGKGSLGTGSFLLSGDREWFRNTQLGLAAFSEDGKLKVVPRKTFERLKVRGGCLISPGEEKKSDSAKKIMRFLGLRDIDEVMQQLPAGSFSVSNENSIKQK